MSDMEYFVEGACPECRHIQTFISRQDPGDDENACAFAKTKCIRCGRELWVDFNQSEPKTRIRIYSRTALVDNGDGTVSANW